MTEKRIVDSEISLVPYYPNIEAALPWYQDRELCMQVDNHDHVYSPEQLTAMYDYLSACGDCFYIELEGRLIGDITLMNNGEISAVICREYQNRHIGRRCVKSLLELAKEKGMDKVRANIYDFNTQSQKMFEAVGFTKTAPEWYACELK